MSSPTLESKGLFAGLFDFSFTTFITLKFLRVIYIILMALIFLFGVIFLLAGLSEGGGTAVAALFLAPLGTLLYLIFARIYMELIALFFRIGENTSLMAARLGGGAPGSAAGGPAGPQAGGFPPAPGENPYGQPGGGYGYGTPPPA